MNTTKASLRSRIKDIRLHLPAGTISTSSSAIRRRLLHLVDGHDTVMVYVSKPPEVETLPLIDDLLRLKKQVVVPIIERDTATLRLSYLCDPSVLVQSTFRVPEPVGAEIPADPSDISIVVVPMIAFDRSGRRVGYGAGYYDRFLSANPRLIKIGIAFSCQQVDAVPSDPFDVNMDYIVTEKEIIDCG